jgi:hypothetical protein
MKHALWSKAWAGSAIVVSLALAGCGSHHKTTDAGPPPQDAEVMDAEEMPDLGLPDAGTPDAGMEPGPKGNAFTTSGGRSSSPHFVVFSTTGQATPVSKGEMKSPSYSMTPGILGGK